MRKNNVLPGERKHFLLAIAVLCIVGMALFFLRSRPPESDEQPQNEEFSAYAADDFGDEGLSEQQQKLNQDAKKEGDRDLIADGEEVVAQSGESAPLASRTVVAANLARKEEADKPSQKQGGDQEMEEESEPEEEVELKVSREEISAGIEAFRPFVRKCYEKTLKDFPDASGTINLAFTMESQDGKGQVFMSEIGENTTLFDDALHDCLLYQISEVDFDLSTPDGHQVYVRYPFTFASE